MHFKVLLLLLALYPAKVVSQDLPIDRELLRAEIRAFLIEQPEVLVEAFDVLQQREQQLKAQSDASLVAMYHEDLFEDGISYIGGNVNGDITVVEFTDYNCGYCKRALSDVSKLIENDENIRFIIKEMPILGEGSLEAAKFSLAVKQKYGGDLYYEIHKALLSAKTPTSAASLERLAKSYDLNYDELASAMSEPHILEALQKNRALAGKMEISGTPAFVVSGEHVSVMGAQILRGYLPYEGMVNVIAEMRRIVP